MKKNLIVTAQTRQNLMDAFWQSYKTKRIESITVKEVTTKAGYNRSTFYEYFSDMYDVLDTIEASLIEELQKVPHDQLSSEADDNPMKAILGIYMKHKDFLTVLIGPKGDPAFQQKVKDTMKPSLKESMILQGAKDDWKLDYTLEYALSAMIGVLNYWFNQDERISLEELMKLMVDISREGVFGGLKL